MTRLWNGQPEKYASVPVIVSSPLYLTPALQCTQVPVQWLLGPFVGLEAIGANN
jgi:hypothetical protein